jgi:predicted RNA-binding Zn-ribbon protein involved in translation (DUF1610 family)
MANETNNAVQTLLQCWSCKAKIVPTNIFCPNCGTWLLSSDATEKTQQQPASPNPDIQSVQKTRQGSLLKKIIIGGALLLLGVWILLQLFGSGG